MSHYTANASEAQTLRITHVVYRSSRNKSGFLRPTSEVSLNLLITTSVEPTAAGYLVEAAFVPAEYVRLGHPLELIACPEKYAGKYRFCKVESWGLTFRNTTPGARRYSNRVPGSYVSVNISIPIAVHMA